MSLPNRNFLETITIPSSQNAVQVLKEKILFSQPQLLPLKLMSTEKYQLSLLNVVAWAQSILETEVFQMAQCELLISPRLLMNCKTNILVQLTSASQLQ